MAEKTEEQKGKELARRGQLTKAEEREREQAIRAKKAKGKTLTREEAGAQDRVRFEVLDAARPLPGKYDLVTTLRRHPRRRRPKGHSPQHPRSPESRGELPQPRHQLLRQSRPAGHAVPRVQPLYCMTTSLARGGAALGTLGLPESKLREFGTEAGFKSVRRVPMQNPFNNLYELTI